MTCQWLCQRLAAEDLLDIMDHSGSVVKLRGHAWQNEALPRGRESLLNIGQ